MDKANVADTTKRLPQLDRRTGINHSPHVVILGAGASRACCPEGDKYGRTLPVMKDFIQKLGLQKTVESLGHNPKENFEAIYNAIHVSNNQSALEELETLTNRYFSSLVLPDGPTIYDYLVLSLRSKDKIVSFNWDPLLPQAFQRWRKLGSVLPELVFLHGNTDIGVNFDQEVYGFLSDADMNIKLTPTPLLFPIEKKDYHSDPFIAEQWQKATSALAEAYFVTIFGYSAPKSDVEARDLLQTAWLSNPTKTLASVDMIDIQQPEIVVDNWSGFIVREQDFAVYDKLTKTRLFMYPRRTCETLAFATLQQQPWHEN